MGYDDRQEILERLEALERMLRDERGSHGHGHGCGGERHRGRERGHHDDRCHDRDHRHEHRRGGGDFEEKRIIDTIVTLVSEQVVRILDDRQPRGRDDGGGEKRIVDLVVGLVSEHVQEIISDELDRRFGRPPLGGAGDRPPEGPGSGESGQS
jgi:hypothetical protein